MGYFARIQNGEVVQVHVLAEAVVLDSEGVAQESLGQEFLSELHGLSAESFVQCFIGGGSRFNYPGPRFSYDADRDAFIPPQPYASWVLDEATCLWEAPVAQPDDGKMYTWDEPTISWIEYEQTS
jgi:hypothetical protein